MELSLMRLSLICAAVISGLSIATVAAAESAPAPTTGTAPAVQPKRGEMIRTADGARVGAIDYVDMAKDGTPNYVGVIYEMRMLHIPVATLSSAQKGYTTSVKRAE